MASEVLYPADAVLEMLVAAYKAGFEGPLEMAKEACCEIMDRTTYAESDLALMEHMQNRSAVRLAPAPAPALAFRKSSTVVMNEDAPW